MNKREFLKQLGKRLPQEDREERLSFYSEMIDDRIEEGLSEEEAVLAVGSAENILVEITPEESARSSGRKWKAWEIVLLVLGSPVWLSLLTAAFAVALSLYAVVWSVILSLWAIFASLAACALAGVVAGAGFMIGGHSASGIALIGAGLICAGLSVLCFLSCKTATKGTVILTGKLLRRCFHRKENIHG